MKTISTETHLVKIEFVFSSENDSINEKSDSFLYLTTNIFRFFLQKSFIGWSDTRDKNDFRLFSSPPKKNRKKKISRMNRRKKEQQTQAAAVAHRWVEKEIEKRYMYNMKQS